MDNEGRLESSTFTTAGSEAIRSDQNNNNKRHDEASTCSFPWLPMTPLFVPLELNEHQAQSTASVYPRVSVLCHTGRTFGNSPRLYEKASKVLHNVHSVGNGVVNDALATTALEHESGGEEVEGRTTQEKYKDPKYVTMKQNEENRYQRFETEYESKIGLSNSQSDSVVSRYICSQSHSAINHTRPLPCRSKPVAYHAQSVKCLSPATGYGHIQYSSLVKPSEDSIRAQAFSNQSSFAANRSHNCNSQFFSSACHAHNVFTQSPPTSRRDEKLSSKREKEHWNYTVFSSMAAFAEKTETFERNESGWKARHASVVQSKQEGEKREESTCFHGLHDKVAFVHAEYFPGDKVVQCNLQIATERHNDQRNASECALAARLSNTKPAVEDKNTQHTHSKDPKSNWEHVCDTCGKSFAHSSSLVTHRRLHTGDKLFTCQHYSRAFRRLSNLSRHQLTHTTAQLYVCHQCNKTFNSASNLYAHMRTHYDYKPFSCEYCGKGFDKNMDMETHQCSHTGEKLHKCPKCGRVFKQPTDLTHHFRTHSNEFLYTCAVCNKGFNQKGNLKSHVYLHSGERPFQCDMCDKRFKVASTLNTHKLTHVPHKPFKCQFCDSAFYRKNTLKSHLLASHPYTGGVCLL